MRRSIRVGLIMRFFLVRRGRKDAKNKAIHSEKVDGDSLTSPFIKEELSLCLSRIHREYEKYLSQKEITLNDLSVDNKKVELNSRINQLNNEKELHEKLLKELDKKIYSIDDYPAKPIVKPLYDEVDFLSYDEWCSVYQAFEKQALYEIDIVKNVRQKERLFNAILKQPSQVKVTEEELGKLILIQAKEQGKLEIKRNMMLERCKQYYSYTLARLSAYWTGVLRERKDDKDTNIQFHSISIFEELMKEIAKIEEAEGLRERGKSYG